VVVGGGPAGAAAALEARRQGLAVSIWERDRFPRHKVCGEFLSAESLSALEEEISLTAYKPAVIRRSEFISARGRVHGFRLAHPARGLSRRVLDEALWRAAARRGAEVHEGEGVRRVELVPGGDGSACLWELDSMGGKRDRARALVISAGRWWSLEGIGGPAKDQAERAGPWLGAKAHFSGLAARDAVEMYYFPGGYCGLAPIESGLYNACCLVARSLAEDAPAVADFAAWIRTISGHHALAERLRPGAQVSKTVTTAPVKPARRRSDIHGALLAGDAAGFLDPFTGDGISIALQSGRLAARVLAGHLKNQSARDAFAEAAEAYRRQLDAAVGGSYRLAGILRALVRAPSWLQESVAAGLPRLGARLEARTRWRAIAEEQWLGASGKWLV
jgi:flavin-dependent dehydrogenase